MLLNELGLWASQHVVLELGILAVLCAIQFTVKLIRHRRLYRDLVSIVHVLLSHCCSLDLGRSTRQFLMPINTS